MDAAGAPGRCAGSLRRAIQAAHACERGNMLSILLRLQRASHGRMHQLLSLEQEMCGRHGDGSAARLTTLLIKTCQHRRVLHARGRVFPFPVNVFALARWSAGKGAVYEIIYVESAGGAWGGGQHSWRRRENTNQPAVCIKAENIIDGRLLTSGQSISHICPRSWKQ